MRWSRSASSLWLLFLASAFAFAALFPFEARAELIDIANTPGICVTDVEYPSNVTSVTPGTTLYNQIRAELTNNPFTIQPSSSTDYDTVQPFEQIVKEHIPSFSNSSSYTYTHNEYGYEVSKSKYTYVMPTKQAVVAYIALDLFETPLPANTRLTFDGFQAPFIAQFDNFDNANTVDVGPLQGTGDKILVWYSNSRYTNNAQLATYNDELGFYEIPEKARYIYVSFRLRWTTTPVNDSSLQYYIYYLNHIHMYWQVIGSDTVSTNNTIENQTDTLMDTTGSDTITDQTTMDGTVQQIEGLTLWQGIEQIGYQIGQMVTTTDSDTTLVFPAFSLMGFTLPTATVDIWQYSPIPQSTVRGFLTFVFVVWYVRYMYALIEQIFGLRFYGWTEDDIPVEAQSWTGESQKNWGLVE